MLIMICLLKSKSMSDQYIWGTILGLLGYSREQNRALPTWDLHFNWERKTLNKDKW